jgi:hypothetical protein
MDSPEERNLWSTWKDCRNPEIKPNMRGGWAHMSGVHAAVLAGIRVFVFWTPSLKVFYQAMVLLNFYNFGVALLLLRAGLDAIPLFPYLVVFLVGLVYEAASFDMARNIMDSDKKATKHA